MGSRERVHRIMGLPLRLIFPNLTKQNHSICSPPSDNYNCIAWAYGVSNKLMWPGVPGYHWPSEVVGVDKLEALKQLYLNEGYEECDNGQRENGFEKVAIYVNEEGPQHAARQLESGRWTSKLGRREDIEHYTLETLEGRVYGKATVFLRKRNV